ncbi:hypothetical protein MMC20_005349, partial [Loxospora ochrophaea]|nr:hypothetical protein [Loxospora ochrophaea]
MGIVPRVVADPTTHVIIRAPQIVMGKSRVLYVRVNARSHAYILRAARCAANPVPLVPRFAVLAVLIRVHVICHVRFLARLFHVQEDARENYPAGINALRSAEKAALPP